MLTLFIGANDVCVACHEDEELSTEGWERNLRTVLDAVRDHVPNVLVNVVELFNVGVLTDPGTRRKALPHRSHSGPQ